MKKLKLTLDDLRVDTFVPETPRPERRMVLGYETQETQCNVGCTDDYCTLYCTNAGGACGETAEGDTMCDVDCTRAETMCAVMTCATAGGCYPC